MSRSLTIREKLLLLILVVLILVLGYMKLFWEPMEARLRDLEGKTQQVQLELQQQTILLTQQQKMQESLDRLHASGDYRPIPAYDNSGVLVSELDAILTAFGAEDCSVEFADIRREQYIFSRPVRLQFSVPTYDRVCGILESLAGSACWNTVSDLSLRWEGRIYVTMQLTYYEAVSSTP